LLSLDVYLLFPFHLGLHENSYSGFSIILQIPLAYAVQ
jgi:hypothetical protein